MRPISGSHSCPKCKKEDATYERAGTHAMPAFWDGLGRAYATRPGKTVVAALADKNAWVHLCKACGAAVAQCPYCRTINAVSDATADCTKCTNMFIVHP